MPANSRPISHALVLPNQNLDQWVSAANPYAQAFERVAVIPFDPSVIPLNRFRDITAVEVPGLWDGNAYAHIQRAFPLVVRVDVIRANTPDDLRRELDQRIRDKDRYGEKHNAPPHVFDRFIFEMPIETRPARVVQGFVAPKSRRGTPHISMDFATTPGAVVKVGADGIVSKVVTANDSLNMGAYVQVSSTGEGKQFILTYAGLSEIRVALGTGVAVGMALGKAAGDRLKLLMQASSGGYSGYALPNVVDPTHRLYWPEMRLRPNTAKLRIRERPGIYASTIGFVTPNDLLEPNDSTGRILEKVGSPVWVSVRYAGKNAYASGEFLDAVGGDDPLDDKWEGVRVPGMNLDANHPLGTPDAALFKHLGWVRLLYNVSLNPAFPEGDSRRYGNTDLNATFNRYLPILQRYAAQGLKIILVFTHQTFGEGQGYVWHQMTQGKWDHLIGKFSDMVGRIAAQFHGKNLVTAYQIWNEQDTEAGDFRAAVGLTEAIYAQTLSATIKAIRRVDSETTIITGGHKRGPEIGSAYMRTVLGKMSADNYPDGIAFHPYGRGPAGNQFSPYGDLGHEVNTWLTVLPGKPVWITEWGVLNIQGKDQYAQDVNNYTQGFLSILRSRYAGKVACACYYAYADSMDNGYGLVRSNGKARDPLYSEYLKG